MSVDLKHMQQTNIALPRMRGPRNLNVYIYIYVQQSEYEYESESECPAHAALCSYAPVVLEGNNI
jgi:hypothetical protein